MAVIPFLLRDIFGGADDTFTVPCRRQAEPHFGMRLAQDLIEPILLQSLLESQYQKQHQQRRQVPQSDAAAVIADKDKYQISLDVQQFAPEEISVKTVDDNTIVVEAKHEERQDDHGYISRHFVRRYVLPEGHDMGAIVSKLSSDGVLTVMAPKKALEGAPTERIVPITHTGPAKVASKPDQQSEEQK